MLRCSPVVLSLFIALAGCAAESDTSDDTAGASPSGSGGSGAGGAGAGGATGGSGGATTTLPNVCEGACQSFDAVIDFGKGQRQLERAFYGLTVADGGPPKLYVELSRAGGTDCPSMTSPTPERLVLLHNISIPDASTVLTDADGISAQYFDFVGDDLLNAVQTPALTISVAPRAIDVCADCLGQSEPSDPDGFFAFDLSVTFDGGTTVGSVYATHCDSLDAGG